MTKRGSLFFQTTQYDIKDESILGSFLSSMKSGNDNQEQLLNPFQKQITKELPNPFKKDNNSIVEDFKENDKSPTDDGESHKLDSSDTSFEERSDGQPHVHGEGHAEGNHNHGKKPPVIKKKRLLSDSESKISSKLTETEESEESH